MPSLRRCRPFTARTLRNTVLAALLGHGVMVHVHADDAPFGEPAGSDPAPQDLAQLDDAGAYYTQLVLMRGQLNLGDELYRLGERDAARHHLAAPAREHLPEVGPVMEQRGLGRIVERIEQLADAAATSESWLDVQDIHEATRMALLRAQTEVDPSLRDGPGFKAKVLLAVAHCAVDRYESALSEGEIADEAAYRSSYAFARQGQRMMRQNEGLLKLSDDSVHEELADSYKELLKAWPSARVPDEAAVSASQLRERLKRFAAAVARY